MGESIAVLSDIHGVLPALDAVLAEVLAGVADEVTTVVCGHTHMPFARLANRRQVVNPGSVGMPYGRAGAHWALLRDGAVELRHTSYDADAVCAEVIAQSAFPEVTEWTDEYLRGQISDADALAVMAPRDGRLRTRISIPAAFPDP